MKTKIFFLLSFIILLAACKNDALIRPGESLDSAYKKAMTLYVNEDFAEAADAFDTITRMGRGTDYGKEAQYYLAESYYKDKNYLLAASEYDRFVSYYPQDERRQEVEFKTAMCYYYQSPRYKLDQSKTKQAIERFQLFNNRYPDSKLVTEAAEKIDELRAKLAHKTYEAADFYYRTDRFEAATIFYNLVIDQYPESKWAERALVRQIETYVAYAERSVPDKQAERYNKAIENYEKFIQLFPESELRGRAENHRDEAVNKLSGISPVTSDAGTSQ